MAARTAGCDASVVHRRTLEAGGRCMTGLAGRCGSNMGAGFGDRFHTLEAGSVMAARTAGGDAGVVHRSASKCSE